MQSLYDLAISVNKRACVASLVRDHRDWSDRQIAKEAGVCQSTVNAYRRKHNLQRYTPAKWTRSEKVTLRVLTACGIPSNTIALVLGKSMTSIRSMRWRRFNLSDDHNKIGKGKRWQRHELVVLAVLTNCKVRDDVLCALFNRSSKSIRTKKTRLRKTGVL